MTKSTEIFSITYFSAKILGVSPYSKKSGKYIHSKINAIHQVLIAVLLAFCTFQFIKNKFCDNFDEKMKTIYFVISFRILSNISNMMVTIFVLTLNAKKFLKLLSRIMDIDNQITFVKLGGFTEKSNRKIRRTLIILNICLQIFVNIIGYSLHFIFYQPIVLKIVIVDFVVGVYPRLVATNMNLIFYSLARFLTEKFKGINLTLLKEVKESKRSGYYPKKVDFCEKLENLVALHKNLVKMSRDINLIFDVHLLLWVGVTFVLFVGDAYIIIHLLLFSPTVKTLDIIFMSKYLLTYIIDIILLISSTSHLCLEASNTEKLVVSIKIDIDKEEERNTVKSAILL